MSTRFLIFLYHFLSFNLCFLLIFFPNIRASASSVFPHPIEKVWKMVHDFTFPKNVISFSFINQLKIYPFSFSDINQFETIDTVTIQENRGSTEVGAIRIVKV